MSLPIAFEPQTYFHGMPMVSTEPDKKEMEMFRNTADNTTVRENLSLFKSLDLRSQSLASLNYGRLS